MITIDLTVRENFDMFRRAWTTTAMPKYKPTNGMGVTESQRIWLKEFGCRMIYGKSGFVAAEFDDDAEWTAFVLRWA